MSHIAEHYEECTTVEELDALLKAKEHPIVYDGFEPSGRMHIAQGLMKALSVKLLADAGCVWKIWIADLFAFLNHKLGGKLKDIQTCGKYFIEIFRAIFKELGIPEESVQFLWTSEEVDKRSAEYWPLVMEIAATFNLKRVMRCCTIMGKTEGESMAASQIFYPVMQCADIFFLKADICQLGRDQKKVNMLARDYCTEKKIKHKPVILSHHMLMGLTKDSLKMSKSNPDAAIFMDDSELDVRRKIKRAYCVPGEEEENPVLEYCKYIIFPWFNKLEVKRSEKNGGDVTFSTYEELRDAFVSEKLHPADLKPALATAVNAILQPIRTHFKENKEAFKLKKSVEAIVKKVKKQKEKAEREAAEKKEAEKKQQGEEGEKVESPEEK
ncbi:Tyrosine--tRNA ligase 1, cytoplasmic [Aduncisulcus paluster]|uniref:tyrosine--tRNA ligase n=1 Tax=Aduncisulcus paluster TaxID=2918883 RepID=A0ABQ5K2G1_9EUKA|nr:Tyrosine--tRNA ligase 1, cytoplasmic [Aduncisulcus paluster]|eukprot:gnl/Carplike_NY0171/1852_a2513_678.p1 GENE.gnl/Carplike_NY0171/1852_a2513_678~~gnl/Carplike_NY0171/1852_a2513_678.p1  ORF type:complete len:383 (+),score=127.86 gnl/Carplike_NY0171/1852_a2513_678:23-1171(+)